METMALVPETLEARSEGELSLDDWETGVEEYQDYDLDKIWGALGLGETNTLPWFNEVTDENPNISQRVDPWMEEDWDKFLDSGKGVPLGPRWHQLVGIVKIMRHAIKGKPLLLMDQVGVGKTMQIIGAITTYVLFHSFYEAHKKFPGEFGK